MRRTILGVGEAQVWSKESIPRVPVFKVSIYSQMLVSALLLYGAQRTEAYLPLARWRKKAKRASCQDMINVLRKQFAENPDLLKSHMVSGSSVETLCLSSAA